MGRPTPENIETFRKWVVSVLASVASGALILIWNEWKSLHDSQVQQTVILQAVAETLKGQAARLDKIEVTQRDGTINSGTLREKVDGVQRDIEWLRSWIADIRKKSQVEKYINGDGPTPS